MRIIAGTARGRRLAVPRGEGVRPTADRVREALFSSLQERLAGAHVLDLFAGAGGLGLEAASRGAATVTFIERDRRALDALARNVDAVGHERTVIVARDVEHALRLDVAGAPFDIVLVDPPYALDADRLDAIIDQLAPHLAAGATVVIERDVRSRPPEWPGSFNPRDPRRYGDTVLHSAVASTTNDGAGGTSQEDQP